MEVTPIEIATYRCKVEAAIARQRQEIEEFQDRMNFEAIKLRNEVLFWELSG
jgi:hypothetical protein